MPEISITREPGSRVLIRLCCSLVRFCCGRISMKYSTAPIRTNSSTVVQMSPPIGDYLTFTESGAALPPSP